MSEEESFVILGSSPNSSIKSNYVGESIDPTLEWVKPASRFTSLKNNQISGVTSAQEIAMVRSYEAEKISLGNQENIVQPQNMAASKLWSIIPEVQDKENAMPLSLEDCALKSPLEQNYQESPQQKINITPPGSLNRNLASSFLMGEINSEVLKTSVYSQFPSICLEANTEEVHKLQSMVTEYAQLKSTIKKANTTMKVFYQNSLQWKEKMQAMEENFTHQLNNCKKEIEELRKQNNEMELNVQTQIEALEIARKEDRAEYIKALSEKSALIENMRAQIIKLEEQKMPHVLSSKKPKEQNEKINELNSLNMEKEKQIQELETAFQSLQIAFAEQNERIVILETQNQVHRTDFEMEKHSRETAVNDKHQILQELRSVQKINQELIEGQQRIADSFHTKIAAFAEKNDATTPALNCFNIPQTTPTRISPSTSSSSFATSDPVFNVCPICNTGFKSLSILLGHVNDCMDRN